MHSNPRFHISFSPVFWHDDEFIDDSNPLTHRGVAIDVSPDTRPDDIVTKKMVASTFKVPSKCLQQAHPMASWCSYKMIKGDKTLNVDVWIQIHDTEKAAAEDFRNATRSIPASQAIGSTGSDGLDTDAAHSAFVCAVSAIRQRGIQFEDVYGIADQARFETMEGTLRLQQGNLRMTLSAFYGPDMAIPDVISAESIMQAVTTWQQNTMHQRKKQTITLAKAAIARL